MSAGDGADVTDCAGVGVVGEALTYVESLGHAGFCWSTPALLTCRTGLNSGNEFYQNIGYENDGVAWRIGLRYKKPTLKNLFLAGTLTHGFLDYNNLSTR